MGGDEFCALISVPLIELQGAIERAEAALSEVGEGFVIGCSYGTVVLPEEAPDIPGALRLADQRMYTQKRGGRASASRQSGDVLLSALQERDPRLRAHLHEVAQMATEVGRSIGLPTEAVEPIRQAAELHDVGKMAIPDAILTKLGPLDEAELGFIRRHTLIGERIIAAAPALHRVAALVRSCHERFDGSGYPDALAATEIPLGSRIIAVCDAFNAMISERPYRRAMSEQAAAAELRSCAGAQFDPVVVEHFCSLLQRGQLSPAGDRQPVPVPVPPSLHA
jgi:two-component system cell cycle response regulator